MTHAKARRQHRAQQRARAAARATAQHIRTATALTDSAQALGEIGDVASARAQLRHAKDQIAQLQDSARAQRAAAPIAERIRTIEQAIDESEQPADCHCIGCDPASWCDSCGCDACTR